MTRTPINTLVYGMHWFSQTAAIKKLEKTGLIQVKVWIGKNAENHIHIGKLRRVRIQKETYSGENASLYDAIYDEAFATFLDMFARNPSQYNITHQEALNLYNYFFDYFSNMLHKNRIELLIFYNFPHFGSDYLLTVIAKHMGIKLLLMYQSLIPNRFHYVSDLQDFGDFKTANTVFEHPWEAVNFEHRKVQFYMKNIKLKERSAMFAFALRLKKWMFRSIGRMTFGGLMKSFADAIKFKWHYEKYKKIDVDFSQKFVYFPLQLQPELTTSTLGGKYTDQLLAIERIANLIPDDWRIYVKENPKQLEAHRGHYFYERLRLVSKAVYVAKTVNSFELIDHCQFVATITGTAGWEAICARKPCVIFGNTWFQNFDGVFKYQKDLTTDALLSHQINQANIEAQYNAMIQKTGNGIVDRGYISNYPNYTDEGNTSDLTTSLTRIIQDLN